MKMSYSEWESLTEAEQKAVPDESLPEIPEAELRNNLILSQMFRQDGALMWRIQKAGAEKSTISPQYRKGEMRGLEVWRKFNPYNATYELNLEPDDEPIGLYGLRWMDFMKREHEHKIPYLEVTLTFRKVARKVEEMAREYRLLLEKQYEETNPRPETFEDTVKWAQTMMFYSDSTVMREIVLKSYSPELVMP